MAYGVVQGHSVRRLRSKHLQLNTFMARLWWRGRKAPKLLSITEDGRQHKSSLCGIMLSLSCLNGQNEKVFSPLGRTAIHSITETEGEIAFSTWHGQTVCYKVLIFTESATFFYIIFKKSYTVNDTTKIHHFPLLAQNTNSARSILKCTFSSHLPL